MSDLPSKTTSPAEAAKVANPLRERIPMSLPVQKLSVPDIPGFHCHWMKSDPQRIAQALRAGYTFVEDGDVELSRFGIAGGETESGNEDLGSRISVVSGKADNGGAERLYLMKLPQEHWDSDQAALARQQEGIAAQLRGDKGFSEAGLDTSNRYAGKQSSENRNIFLPKRRP